VSAVSHVLKAQSFPLTGEQAHRDGFWFWFALLAGRQYVPYPSDDLSLGD